MGMRGVSLSVALGVACSPPAHPTRTESIAVATDAGAPAQLVVEPTASPPSDLARWVPADGPDGFRDLGDGRRGAVTGGRRIVLTQKLVSGEGGTASVVDAKPLAGLGQGRRVPHLLGGGWLFVSEHHLYFGRAYDGALRLVASDLEESDVGVGHDLVLVRTPQGVDAYELSSGNKVALPVPNAEQIFGLKTGEVAARTGTGDVFLSAGRGKPFVKVAGTRRIEMLGYDGKTFVLVSRHAEDRLALDGKVSPRPPEPGTTSSDNLFAFQGEWPDPDMAKSPIRADVEHLMDPLAIAMSDQVVLAVHDRSLVVFDGKTGKITSTQTGVFAGHENCFPIRGGTPSFIGCNSPKEMTLFRVDAPDKKPVAERTFKGVYTQDLHGLVDAPLAMGKRCDGTQAGGTFCVRKDDGTWTELAPPPDPEKILARMSFLVHVAVSSDGAPYGFGWEGGNGALVIIDGRGKSIRRVQKEAMPRWAADGIRWSAVSVRDGVIRFLIETESPGTLAIHPDGRIEAKQLEGRVAGIGARGVHIAPDGKLRETLDGGISFHDVAAPPGGADLKWVRCVEAGCSVGPWHRLGWGP